MKNKINTLTKQSRKAGIEKEIPRVLWIKEDLKIMKKNCKEDECPQKICVDLAKRHLN
jgi:hypothetical protein